MTYTPHQFCAYGTCHAITSDGVALVEMRGGSVSRYDLTGCYSLRFTDTPETS